MPQQPAAMPAASSPAPMPGQPVVPPAQPQSVVQPAVVAAQPGMSAQQPTPAAAIPAQPAPVQPTAAPQAPAPDPMQQQLQQMIQMQQLQSLQDMQEKTKKASKKDVDASDLPSIQVNVGKDSNTVSTKLTKPIPLSQVHYLIGSMLVLLAVWYYISSFGVVSAYVSTGLLGDLEVLDVVGGLVAFSGLGLMFVRNKIMSIFSMIVSTVMVVIMMAVPMYQSFGLATKSVFTESETSFLPVDMSQEYTVATQHIWGLVTLTDTTDAGLAHLDYRGDRAINQVLDPDDATQIQFVEDHRWNILHRLRTDIDMALLPAAPVHLYFKGGVGDYLLDLTDHNYQSIRIEAPYAKSHIKLPTRSAELEINGRWVDTTLEIPDTLGVQLHYDRVMGAIELVNFEQIEPGLFQSLGYDNSASKLKVHVDGFVNNFGIVRVGG